ncbi:hypothetical protein [Anaerocolumna jejuensis]|uniref:hypothetical protein n=1 Tax=Anaerocolumna jejuensis TaxID=259063 RepID=UPI00147D48DA|nr:hypothetical protein [Anaerocolumna jejuensis]
MLTTAPEKCRLKALPTPHASITVMADTLQGAGYAEADRTLLKLKELTGKDSA